MNNLVFTTWVNIHKILTDITEQIIDVRIEICPSKSNTSYSKYGTYLGNTSLSIDSGKVQKTFYTVLKQEMYGEGGADLPVINEGIDLMRFVSGRSVDLERVVVRSRRGRCSVDLDL
ncbi:hypothetical protein E5288_WYG011258 [Bos mutus]|uniref:Uncharacterized protein n=1 Tax=Bos mutus TaxID=72004 RepID=A0A6B0RB32_9CETA|nr:hypothetical protein [Bos mutus]